MRAHFDDARVLLWQAHGAEVARHALAHGSFGGPQWRLGHITRVRTSLPSVLARSAWARKPGREHILGIWMARTAFDALLRQAVPADFEEGGLYASRSSWRLATRFAQVTASWHPQLDAFGEPTGGQAVRLGVREHALRTFASDQVLAIEDWTDRVLQAETAPGSLQVPGEAVYPMSGAQAKLLAGEA